MGCDGSVSNHVIFGRLNVQRNANELFFFFCVCVCMCVYVCTTNALGFLM